MTATESQQYIYGISRESILDELNFLKVSFELIKI